MTKPTREQIERAIAANLTGKHVANEHRLCVGYIYALARGYNLSFKNKPTIERQVLSALARGADTTRKIAAATGFPHEAVSGCLLYTSPSPRDGATSRMPSSA